MKEKLLKKSNLWHLGAIATFLVIACVYFYPALQGYSVDQDDVKNWVGAASEIQDYRQNGDQVGWTNGMFSGMPGTQILGNGEGLAVYQFIFKAFQLWLPRPVGFLFLLMFGFYLMCISFKVRPIVAMIGAVAYALSSYFIVIIEVGHVTKVMAVGYAPLVIAGFMFAYRWKNWVLGVALSALFMTLELLANHPQITYYLIFLMVGLGVVELIRHLKIEGGVKRFAIISGSLIAAYLLAAMININNLLGTSEYAAHTIRGGSELTINPDGSPKELETGLDIEYITRWSYGKSETFTFLIPNFKGGKSQVLGANPDNNKHLKKAGTQNRQTIKEYVSQYWGDQPGTSGPVYIGAIVMLLAALSLYYTKDRVKWALLVVTLLTVMLGWGKNFMGLTEFFIDYVPGYDKLRAVTIILVIAELCIPLMGVLFLQRLYDAKDDIVKNIKPFYIICGSFIFILLIFGLFPGMFNFLTEGEIATLENMPAGPNLDFFTALYEDAALVRQSIFRADVWRTLAFIVLSAGVIFGYLKSAYSHTVFGAIILALVLVDLVMVDSRYLGTEKSGKNFKQWTENFKAKYPYVMMDGEEQILQMELAQNPFLAEKIDSALSILKSDEHYNDKSTTGAERQRMTDWIVFRVLNRYTNFRVYDQVDPFNSSHVSYFNKSIGGYHGAKLGRYQDLIMWHIAGDNPAVLDMLNTKYFWAPIYKPNTRELENTIVTGVNSTALGNAWLTKDVRIVENANEEISALRSQNVYDLMAFGEHKILINGKVDTAATVTAYDNVKFLFNYGIDSTGRPVVDTIDMNPSGDPNNPNPYAVPFKSVSDEKPLAFVFIPPSGTAQANLVWTYASNVDTVVTPLIGAMAGGRQGWDPLKETIIDKRYQQNISQQTYSGEGSIVMTSYHPDRIAYSFSSPEKQLAVFSEIYYPVGWKAYIDGAEVPISCVNYTLRAIEAPAGDYAIEFVYKLEREGSTLTYIYSASALMLLLFGAGFFYQRKVDKGEVKTNDEA